MCEYSPLLESENIVSEISDKFGEYSYYLDAQAEAYEDEYRHWIDDYPDTESYKIDNLFATIQECN